MVAPPSYSPERRSDPASDSNASEFALLLVQEWLVASKLESTARCLVDECARTDRVIPSRLTWNRMTASLGFSPRSPATGWKRSGGSTTLLEGAIRKLVDQHEKDLAQTCRSQPQQQQVVLMSKKAPVRDVKFVSKRFLPKFAPPSNNAHNQSPEHSTSSPTLGLRPKSAFICKSTPDLISRTIENESSKTTTGPGSSLASNAGALHPTAKKAGGMQLRPISAASVLTAHRDAAARKQSNLKSAGNNPPPTHSPAVNNGLVSTALDHSSSLNHLSNVMTRTSLPHITESTGPVSASRINTSSGDADAEEDFDNTPKPERRPTLALEEMNEVRLMQQFGSISRCAIKKLRRVLAKSHACTQELEKSQRTVDKIKARAKLRQVRRVLAEEQTELLSSTMAPLISEPCSLCLYVFPKINLTTKVSYKSIADLRASWAAANGAEVNVEAGDDEAGAGDASNNNEAPKEQIAAGMTHARMTHLYDEAPVCAFCSQLVLNFSTYRPSSAERRAQELKQKREALKSLKAREAAERRNLERCDPLDYNSYELNSDNDDSEEEEIVELKPDGRPQVVRRCRRQTMRTPVPLGVVSKRLHYETLRSDSLHKLTLDEWQKIIR